MHPRKCMDAVKSHDNLAVQQQCHVPREFPMSAGTSYRRVVARWRALLAVTEDKWKTEWFKGVSSSSVGNENADYFLG